MITWSMISESLDFDVLLTAKGHLRTKQIKTAEIGDHVIHFISFATNRPTKPFKFLHKKNKRRSFIHAFILYMFYNFG